MKRLLLIALATVSLIFAPTLRAAQHLWDIQEVYTNSDGSVQFIQQGIAMDIYQKLGCRNDGKPASIP